jgi:hypothetical protein
VGVRVSDEVGCQATSSTQVLVNNVPPTITKITNDGPVNEGSPATITVEATDASKDDTLLYHFLCGSAVLPSGNSAQCTFPDNGTYRVGVFVIDDDGGVALDFTEVTVNNVAPTATLSNNGPIDEGESATISFADQSDASSADEATGFRYEYHCDGSPFSGAADYATAGSSDSTTCTLAMMATRPLALA